MKSFRCMYATRLFAAPLLGLLLASCTLPLNAQTSLDSASTRPFAPAYKNPQEITLTGVVREVISAPAPHRPIGQHLVIASPQGAIDAHLGPYLSDDVLKALYALNVEVIVNGDGYRWYSRP